MVGQMPVWTTKNGDEIPYNKLGDVHLLNILKYIERSAQNGIVLKSGGGNSPDDFYYNEENLEGDDVKEHFDYDGLKKEAKRRKLL